MFPITKSSPSGSQKYLRRVRHHHRCPTESSMSSVIGNNGPDSTKRFYTDDDNDEDDDEDDSDSDYELKSTGLYWAFELSMNE